MPSSLADHGFHGSAINRTTAPTTTTSAKPRELLALGDSVVLEIGYGDFFGGHRRFYLEFCVDVCNYPIRFLYCWVELS
jgi:hypothetical protein